MTLWPRTLFARTALVVGLLILVTELSIVPVLDLLLREARAERLAELEVSRVRMAAAGHRALSGMERERFAEELDRATGIRVTSAGPLRARRVDGGGFLGALAEAIRRELGGDSEVYLGHEGGRGLWIRTGAEGRETWVFLPGPPIGRGFPWELVAGAVAALALAALGAVGIVWRTGRQLRVLSEAARRVGQGEAPPPLSLRGPEEIRALSESFNRMSLDLQRLTEDREFLLSGISHDLRTPLTRLRLAVAMLPPEVEEETQGMIADVEDAEAIATQLQSFVDAQSEATVSGPLDEIVGRVTDRYARLGMAVALDLAPLPPVRFRPLALQRLLTNLLDNAFKHGGGAGEVRTARRDGHAVVRVLDRGPGLSPGHIERLTRSLSAVGAPPRDGGGLGLAVAARLARAHGTRLDLRPREGGGLEASFDIPFDSARG